MRVVCRAVKGCVSLWKGQGLPPAVGPDCPVKVCVNCVKAAFLPIAASGVGVHDRVPV